MQLKGLISLSFGTLGLGITEFVAMGLLPFIAATYGISIAQAGHFITAYALGVAFGAFALLFLRALKLKTILLMLILVHIAGNLFTVLAPDFNTLLAARFIAGLPHGSFFGVGSIIAQRIASKDKGSSAVSIMVAGMTISNIFGVPLGTALAEILTFKAIFCLVVIWGMIVLFSCHRWIRDTGKIENTGFFGQFAFLKHPAPWLVLGATMFGNAGIFCMQSYISPILTELAGIKLHTVPAVLVAMGICMVMANFISGRLCDRFTPGKVGAYAQVLAVILLLGIALFGHSTVICIILICLTAGVLFSLSSPEQVSILRTAPGGLLLGAASVQAAFNLGNALGASAGGVPFTFDLSIRLVTAIGAALAFIGFGCLWLYAKKYEKEFSKDLH